MNKEKGMKYPCVCLSLVLCIAGCLNSEPRVDNAPAEKPKEKPIALEYKLATLNAGNSIPSDYPTIARFRKVLDMLSEKYVENDQQIADMTVRMTEILQKDDGIKVSILDIMEGISKVLPSKVEKQKYAVHIASYGTVRSNGKSHEETIKALQEISTIVKDLPNK